MVKEKKNIVWLASYPKSGNTWVRIFLSNVLSDSDQPVNINEINLGQIASHRSNFEEYAGVESSDLTHEEIDNLRPQVYRRMSAESDQLLFIKVHDAWQLTPSGEPMFPPDVTFKTIYIVRHPLSVMNSFANHNGSTYKKTLRTMMNETYAFASDEQRLNTQLKQYLSSWENHVNSWTEASGLPVYFMKYEVLHADPEKEFSMLCQVLGVKVTRQKLRTAVQFSTLKELRTQEQKDGFREKPMRARQFFATGLIQENKNIKANLINVSSQNFNPELLQKLKYTL